MNILLLSSEGDGAALCARFEAEGHRPSLWIKDRAHRGRWDGRVRKPATLEAGLATRPDLVVCDATDLVAQATLARAKGLPVLGGSPLADRLEHDRMWALGLARQCGIRVPTTYPFRDAAAVRRFITTTDEGPFVLKCLGNVDCYTTFVAERNDDILAFLDHVDLGGATGFILQERLPVVAELNTEVWFASGVPLPSPNGGMEQKRFLAGDMGWNTGCESYIVWPYTEERPPAALAAFPDPLLAWLRQQRYTGPLDVAMILSAEDHELWMTEFTPRFGYSSIYAMLGLLPDGFDFGHFLHALAVGEQPTLEYRSDLTATALTVSTPPYPYAVSALTIRGQRVGDGGVPREYWWPIDVQWGPRGPVTAGTDGLLGFVTAADESLSMASAQALQRASMIDTPTKQFRMDAFAQASALWALDLIGLVDRMRFEPEPLQPELAVIPEPPEESHHG